MKNLVSTVFISPPFSSFFAFVTKSVFSSILAFGVILVVLLSPREEVMGIEIFWEGITQTSTQLSHTESIGTELPTLLQNVEVRESIADSAGVAIEIVVPELKKFPETCVADYDYRLSTCSLNIKNARQCVDFSHRQAIDCKLEHCQDRLERLKRSFFLWSIIVSFVAGIVIAFAGPAVGGPVLGIAVLLMVFSTAPLLDVVRFLFC